MRLLFFGPPGAGKGTQAQYIAHHFDIPHISTGNIFRENIAYETPLGLEVKRYADEGDLVPDELTNALIEDYLTRLENIHGFLLDGYPRTLAQAEYLDRFLAEHHAILNGVINLRVPDEVIIDRLTKRGRTDDSLKTVRHRLEIYHERTAPLVHWYRAKDILRDIDGVGYIDEITQRILSALNHA